MVHLAPSHMAYILRDVRLPCARCQANTVARDMHAYLYKLVCRPCYGELIGAKREPTAEAASESLKRVIAEQVQVLRDNHSQRQDRAR